MAPSTILNLSSLGNACITKTEALAVSPLFHPVHKSDPEVGISYARAKKIATIYGLTWRDCVELTPKFWELHMDNIMALDTAAFTLLTIQYNLTLGTLGRFAGDRPDLHPLLEKIARFDVSAQFLLTENGHGLDAPNLETTATLLPNNEFDLHTPHPRAAKYMPPTKPIPGLPRVAVVMARLIVESRDYGVHGFVVDLNDGRTMAPGITSRVLPPRAGSSPVDHALTSFNHVRLPRRALLGPMDKPENMRTHFMRTINRVAVGSLSISLVTIPCLKLATYVAGMYSLRRTVGQPDGTRQPIMSFRTQQKPVLLALAQIYCLEAFGLEAIRMFRDPTLDIRVRDAVAACFKSVAVKHGQESMYSLAERSGAQGLFEFNHIIEKQLELRGASIAEGDTLALCIRLASELLLNRYAVPATENPNSLLAKHEKGLFSETQRMANAITAKGGHRSDVFNRTILPLCQPLIESMGLRMAYDAAIKHGVDPILIDVYQSGCISTDRAWFSENGLQRREQFQMEDAALTAALPHIGTYLRGTNAQKYAKAPIVSETAWTEFVNNLTYHSAENQPAFSPTAPFNVGLDVLASELSKARL
ncbi:acyl-CoA dehydrogenase NM domain-like protein [Ramaria rubella]|nr:acyl-CoA dehydrogenase NM domain-like protein [Ramaria rubella]